MQSQRSLEPQFKSAPASPILVEAEKLFDQMKELSQSVARRAYEFFEARGRELGHDLDDWIRAESELLRRVPVEITESDDQLTVRAEVPGFSADEVQVSVEPRRLVISGKSARWAEQKSEGVVYTERRSNQFCRALELPAEVDPARAGASLKDGVLELTLPRVAPSQAVQVEVKTP